MSLLVFGRRDHYAEDEAQQRSTIARKGAAKGLQRLIDTLGRLERHYTDIQDVEFTVQDEQLFILQTRNAKRTAGAALKIAVDLVEEDLIDEGTALMRVDP